MKDHYPHDGWMVEIGAWSLALLIPIAAFALIMALIQ